VARFNTSSQKQWNISFRKHMVDNRAGQYNKYGEDSSLWFCKISLWKCYDEHLRHGQFHNHHCHNCSSVRKCIFVQLAKSKQVHSAYFECMHCFSSLLSKWRMYNGNLYWRLNEANLMHSAAWNWLHFWWPFILKLLLVYILIAEYVYFSSSNNLSVLMPNMN
jgi:hypothetical protein